MGRDLCALGQQGETAVDSANDDTCRSMGDACVPLWTALRMGFATITASIASFRSLYLALAVRSAFCAAVRSSSSFAPENSSNVRVSKVIFHTGASGM